MGVVNQRVCDLETCAQPITPKTGAIYVMPQFEDGEPDVERKAEFEAPKCAKGFLRGMDTVAKDARLRDRIDTIMAEETAGAERDKKVAELTKKISDLSADAYAFPEAPEEDEAGDAAPEAGDAAPAPAGGAKAAPKASKT